ncbi:MAG: hypothetical protein AAF725_12445 [Acidobacteriota bacterium]
MKKSVWLVLICLLACFATTATAASISSPEAAGLDGATSWVSALWHWLSAALGSLTDPAPVPESADDVVEGELLPIEDFGPGVIPNG